MRFKIDNVDREITVNYRIVPENARKRVVIQDESGAYFKIVQIVVRHTTALGAKALFYGVRIHPETGAHIDPAPVHFLPDPAQVRGIKEDIENLIRDHA